MRERREDCMVCKWVIVACTHSLLFTASWLPYARLQRQSNLPSRYLSSIRKSDEQRERLEQIRRIKEAKTTKAKEVYNFILQHTTHTNQNTLTLLVTYIGKQTKRGGEEEEKEATTGGANGTDQVAPADQEKWRACQARDGRDTGLWKAIRESKTDNTSHQAHHLLPIMPGSSLPSFFV